MKTEHARTKKEERKEEKARNRLRKDNLGWRKKSKMPSQKAASVEGFWC